MDAKELMIGDWVYQAQFIHKDNPKEGHGWKPVKVNMIPFDEDCFIEPIPLTPEILEKNGLKHRFSDSDFTEYEEWYSEDRRFRVIKDKDDYFGRIEDENLMYTKAMGVANYVHELQHIINYANYKKGIEL